jgi:hypothetical protein
MTSRGRHIGDNRGDEWYRKDRFADGDGCYSCGGLCLGLDTSNGLNNHNGFHLSNGLSLSNDLNLRVY